jgi:GTP cyclohydrolase I
MLTSHTQHPLTQHPLTQHPLKVEPERRLVGVGRNLLLAVGEDPSREGLLRTPERFAKAMMELCIGYDQTVAEVVGEGVFAAEGSGLVSVRGVEFHSLCEHHVLPFWGKASVAYYPSAKILGLSKIPRIVDCFAKRLQVQERLTKQIAEGIAGVVSPRAVLVRVEAEHMCMRMRGVEKNCGATVTEFIVGDAALSETERNRLWAALV